MMLFPPLIHIIHSPKKGDFRMPLLVTAVSEGLTEEMDRLRCLCFPEPDGSASSRDEFDSRSLHVVTMVEGDLAAYGRLTPGPKSVFETWTHGKAIIPTGPNIVDLGRCLVAPQYRGLDLMMLVCLEALLLSARIGYDVVVGSVVPGRRTTEMLKLIGFENSGSAVQCFKEKPTGPYCIQPLVAHCTQTDLWSRLRRDLILELATKNYDVQSGISTCDVDSGFLNKRE
jgi:hypothetical protein